MIWGVEEDHDDDDDNVMMRIEPEPDSSSINQCMWNKIKDNSSLIGKREASPAETMTMTMPAFVFLLNFPFLSALIWGGIQMGCVVKSALKNCSLPLMNSIEHYFRFIWFQAKTFSISLRKMKHMPTLSWNQSNLWACIGAWVPCFCSKQ